jgi:putative acyl-CoA dehydrogenase
VPATLPTHEVRNQSPPLLDHNAFEADLALREALDREGGGWGVDRCREIGAAVASTVADEHCRRAQRNTPVLHTHDRFGHRIDRVEYDPGFHWMLRQGIERGLSGMPWRDRTSSAPRCSRS